MQIYTTKELLHKIHLTWYHAKVLMQQGYITKIKKGKFTIDEDFFLTFDAERFKQDRELQRAAKQSNSLQKFMDNRTDDYKKSFSQTCSKASTKVWQNADDDFREKHRKSCIEAQARPEVKSAVSNGLIKAFATKESKLKLRERNIRSWKNPEQRKNRLDGIHKAYDERGQEILAKSNETKKKNGTLNSSKSAEECKQILRNAGFTVIEERLYPNSELKCDAHVVELNLWIEFHFHWAHGYMPYVKSCPVCQKQLNKWRNKAKSSTTYVRAIKNWTQLDTLKLKLSRDNNLNYLCFYSKKSFESWFKSNF